MSEEAIPLEWTGVSKKSADSRRQQPGGDNKDEMGIDRIGLARWGKRQQLRVSDYRNSTCQS